MTSPLKFQAWDTKNKKFLKSRDFCIYNGQPVRIEKIHGSGHEPAEVGFKSIYGKVKYSKGITIMQSTGLTDKNGKEIFEGDIVRWDGQISEVKYEGSSFVHQPFAKPHGKVPVSHCVESDIEIIGNKFENPSLITHQEHE